MIIILNDIIAFQRLIMDLFSIESALLEKILLHETSKHNEKIAHALSDLEAWCDRQKPSIWGIVEESLGVNKQAINIITRTIETFKYRVCTGFGVSSIIFREIHERPVGTGQVNMVSGSICRDQSCLAFN